jgi:hypothetical protein
LDIGLDLAGPSRKALGILGDAELEVALFPPIGAPGVADLPELWAVVLIVLSVLSEANKGHSVVDLSRVSEAALAIRLSDDTRFVPHEASRVGMHGKTHRAKSHNLLKSLDGNVVFLLLIVVLDSLIVLRLPTAVLSAVVGVRIVTFLNYALLFSEIVGIEHPATPAALINVVTVHEVLNRHPCSSGIVFYRVPRLHGRSSSEGPARPTATLVTRDSHFARFMPVNIRYNGRVTSGVFQSFTE